MASFDPQNCSFRLDQSRYFFVREHPLCRLVQIAQLENQLLELLIQNLSRFNDQLPTSSTSSKPTATELSDLESDSKSIYHLLGLIENLLSFKPELSLKILEEDFLNWLLKRIARSDENGAGTGAGAFDQNKAYAAEILAIICGGQTRRESLKEGGERGWDRESLGCVGSEYDIGLRTYDNSEGAAFLDSEIAETFFDLIFAPVCRWSNLALPKESAQVL